MSDSNARLSPEEKILKDDHLGQPGFTRLGNTHLRLTHTIVVVLGLTSVSLGVKHLVAGAERLSAVLLVLVLMSGCKSVMKEVGDNMSSIIYLLGSQPYRRKHCLALNLSHP